MGGASYISAGQAAKPSIPRTPLATSPTTPPLYDYASLPFPAAESSNNGKEPNARRRIYARLDVRKRSVCLQHPARAASYTRDIYTLSVCKSLTMMLQNVLTCSNCSMHLLALGAHCHRRHVPGLQLLAQIFQEPALSAYLTSSPSSRATQYPEYFHMLVLL